MTMGMAEIPEGWWESMFRNEEIVQYVSLESPASIQLRFQHGGLCDGGLSPHSSDLRPRGGMPWLDRKLAPSSPAYQYLSGFNTDPRQTRSERALPQGRLARGCARDQRSM